MPNIYNCNLKLLKHPDRLKTLAETRDCAPINIEFHPTMRCNHQCKRCGVTIDKLKSKTGEFLEHADSAGNHCVELPYDVSADFIHGFAELGVKSVTFLGGGEPLIYPWIENLMQLVVDHGMDFGVITNLDIDLEGNPKLLDVLTQHATFVRVSLDAATESTHNALHRPNRKLGAQGFTRVTHNIELLAHSNPTLGINYLIQPESMYEIPDAALLCSTLGADYIKYTPVHTDKSGGEYTGIMKEIDSLVSSATHIVEAAHLRVIQLNERITSMVENNKDYPKCYWQAIRPVVGADGWLYPCCVLNYYKHARIVNIRDYPCFRLAWESKERKAFLAGWDATKCPLCWVDEENRLVNYVVDPTVPHINFA